MSLNSEITRIENAKADIKDAIEEMGGEVGDGTIDTYATAVRSIPTGVGTETDPVFTNSPAYGITSNDITNWNGKSDFSGSYSDLTNKPSIPAVVQFDTMPSASQDNVGQIVQFTGTTTVQYTNGYFYKCISTTDNNVTSYSWENLNVQKEFDAHDYFGLSISDRDMYIAFWLAGNSALKDHSTTFSSADEVAWFNNIFEKQSQYRYILIVDMVALSIKNLQNASIQKFIPFYVCGSGFSGSIASSLQFYGTNNLFTAETASNNSTNLIQRNCSLTFTKGTNKYTMSKNDVSNITVSVLNTSYSGSNVYTPSNDNHPANKKYVDDTLLNIASLYSSSNTYSEGDCVIYNGKLYVCNTSIATSENWTLSHWTNVTVTEIIKNLHNL